jgi:peptidoglycan hydrolase-like protein with peptidoglycan-binding domain
VETLILLCGSCREEHAVANIDSKLAAALKQARHTRMNFIFVANGSSQAKLVLSKKPLTAKEVADVKRAVGSGTIFKGRCVTERGKLVFETAKQLPQTLGKQLKTVIKDSGGVALAVETRVAPDLTSEVEAAPAEATEPVPGEPAVPAAQPAQTVAAPTSAAKEADLRADVTKRLALLVETYKEAVSQNSPEAARMEPLMASLKDLITRNQYGEVGRILAELEPLVGDFKRRMASDIMAAISGRAARPAAAKKSPVQAPQATQPQGEPKFNPPPSEKEPTLRLGDRSSDGWVEYLQQQLNTHLATANLKVDGIFGPATHKALLDFQKLAKIQVDGVAGNQTWAELRHGPAQAPGTDGRKPHTFEEQGAKARWFIKDDFAMYDVKKDTLFLFPISVGNKATIEGASVNVFVTPPGGKRQGMVAKVGAPAPSRKTPSGQGQVHEVKIPAFRQTFPSVPQGAGAEKYVIEAYFDSALGGDFWSTAKGHVAVIA